LTTRFSCGEARVEPHPILMAVFEEQVNGSGNGAVKEMAEK
jgi:hypothetical protein